MQKGACCHWQDERRRGKGERTLCVAAADSNAINRVFGCKENTLCELVSYVFETQFSTAAAQLAGVTDVMLPKPLCNFSWRNRVGRCGSCI